MYPVYRVKSVSPCLGARKNSISTLNFTKLHLARVKDVQSVDFRLLRRSPRRGPVEKLGTFYRAYLQDFHLRVAEYSLILAFESLTWLNRTVFRFLVEMCRRFRQG